MKKEESELLLYACEKFDAGEYDAALEAFILAYGKGYESAWILKNIYDCYMSGNEETFRTSYEKRRTGTDIPYDACTLDFIPYKEGEYYLFDKERQVFCGIFSMKELQAAWEDSAFGEMEFSAAAVALNWDFREEKGILQTAQERKLYVVCYDMKRCLSFWKVPELRECLENIELFSGYEELQDYFHENTSVYLPRVFYGNREERKRLGKIREEEHQYRLTPQGRNTENVLLTIAIPTAHRGNLLLKRLENLLALPYDAEIEIAVSKNGNDLYEEEYERASRIEDARLHYQDRGELLEHAYYNWNYVVEMSCGKYVMITSDEDEVFAGALEHYLKLLSIYPDLCLVRPRSTDLYRDIKEREYGKKGWEAFDVMFLTQYHFPGMIVRRKDFLEADLLSLEKYSDNVYYKYYPHEWWWVTLSQYGDCIKEPVTLNDDSHPADRKKEWEISGIEDIDTYIPAWKLYESRIEQFKGQVEMLQSVMKIEDKEKLEKYLNRAIGKAILLFEINKETDGDSEEFKIMLDKLAQVCIETIEGLPLELIQKERQLCCLGNWLVELTGLEK